MLHLSSLIALVVWSTLAVWLSGSLLRSIRNREHYLDDPIWALFCLVACLMVLYVMRSFTDMAAHPVTQDQIDTSLGLRLIGIGIAIAIGFKRHKRGGWRW